MLDFFHHGEKIQLCIEMQIEPAIPKTIESFIYEDYHPLETNYYLKRTKYWSIKFKFIKTKETDIIKN